MEIYKLIEVFLCEKSLFIIARDLFLFARASNSKIDAFTTRADKALAAYRAQRMRSPS